MEAGCNKEKRELCGHVKKHPFGLEEDQALSELYCSPSSLPLPMQPTSFRPAALRLHQGTLKLCSACACAPDPPSANGWKGWEHQYPSFLVFLVVWLWGMFLSDPQGFPVGPSLVAHRGNCLGNTSVLGFCTFFASLSLSLTDASSDPFPNPCLSFCFWRSELKNHPLSVILAA